MNAISKTCFLIKLGNKVDNYNHTYHITITMKPADVKSRTYTDFDVENIDKDSKFEVADYVKYQDIKLFLQKDTNQIGQRKFFVDKKS